MRARIFVSLSLTFALIVGILPQVLRAQTAAATTALTLPVGSMFEVIAFHGVAEPDVSWTMTHESTFLDSRRGHTYQTRLIQPGRYILQGALADITGNQQIVRQFVITARPEIVPALPSAGPNILLVDTWPVRDAANRIVSDEPVSVIKIVPNPAATMPFNVDPDPAIDTDNDGNPENDQFSRGTAFSSNGSALFLWFADDADERTMVISNSTGETEELHVVTTEIATAEDEERAQLARENPEIVRTYLGRDTVGLGANLSDKPYASEPLLLHWDFGDGHQSLLDQPVHQYAANETYDVTLTVTNLNTGAVEDKFISIVEIDTESTEPLPGEEEEEEPLPEPEPEEEEEEEPSSSGSLGRTIRNIFFIALISVIAGFGLMFVLARVLRKRGLQSAVDKFEEKLITKKEAEAAVVIDAPAPTMELPDNEPPSEPEPEPEPEPKPIVSPTEVIDTSDIPDGKMPAWLKNGTETTPPPKPQPAPEPKPAPIVEAPAPVMPPEPIVAEEVSDTEEIDADETDDDIRIPPEEWAKLTPEERERERKRLKRRRYRQNKRQRVKEEKSDTEPKSDSDVKFIVSADSLNQTPPTPPESDDQKAA